MKVLIFAEKSSTAFIVAIFSQEETSKDNKEGTFTERVSSSFDSRDNSNKLGKQTEISLRLILEKKYQHKKTFFFYFTFPKINILEKNN